MDNDNENSPAAAAVSAGSKRQSRGSVSSSESDRSDMSDSDSSASAPARPSPPPRKKARAGRHDDRGDERVDGDGRHDRRSVSIDADMDQRFAILSHQLVSHINNILAPNYYNMHAGPTCSSSLNVSNSAVPFTQNLNVANNDSDFLHPPETINKFEDIANLSVTVKEPTVVVAIPERVTKLAALQRFDSPDWNSVRYTDTQKKYVASPGFVESKVNEELKRFDDTSASSSWSKMERSFAALSNAVMAQNELVNTALQNLIDWSAKPDSQLSPNTLYTKLKELFGNDSGYKTATHDILQIICGKRAEVLETRRRFVLKNLKVKYMRDDLEKIPPSSEYMFAPQSLANYLQKIGGIDKLDKQSTPFPRPVRGRSPQEKTFQQPRTTNKPRRNEKKESAGRNHNDDSTSKKRGGGGRIKNTRKPYRNNKP